MTRPILLALLSSLTLVACKDKSDDSGGGSAFADPASSGFLGIYEMSSWTRNAESCDGAGDDQMAANAETHLLVQTAEFFVTYLSATTCADQAACEADVGGYGSGWGSWSFFEGSDSAGWTGSVSYGYEEEGACVASATIMEMTGSPGADLQIESRTYALGDLGMDADGFCNLPDDPVAAADGKPCSGAEQVDASFVVALP